MSLGRTRSLLRKRLSVSTLVSRLGETANADTHERPADPERPALSMYTPDVMLLALVLQKHKTLMLSTLIPFARPGAGVLGLPPDLLTVVIEVRTS